MIARRPTHARLQSQAKPKGNLLYQLLDPIDLLAEVIFSVLIILTFTLWFGIMAWFNLLHLSFTIHRGVEHPQVRLVNAETARGRARLRGDCKVSCTSQ